MPQNIGTGLAALASVDQRIKDENAAGSSTRIMARNRELQWLWLALEGLLCLAIINWVNWTNIRAAKLSTSVFCLLGLYMINRWLLPRMDWLDKRAGHATRGANAEERVGAILDRLPNVQSVLHDVPAAFGNIDHVVIRNDGAVFLIETKSHRGRITLQNGQILLNGRPTEKNFIVQTQRNVAWLKEDLKKRFDVMPWVHAAIVFTDAYVTKHMKTGGVCVINVSYLEGWMKRQAGQRDLAARLKG